MKEFRDRLQHAAKWRGVQENQAGIAAALGLRRQTINRWFGGGEPNAEMLLHTARVFGVDPEWLKSGSGEMLPKPSPDGLSVEERDLIKSYRMAPANIRDVLRSMARAAKKSIVTVAWMIPPLMAPQQSEAAICHKNVFAELPKNVFAELPKYPLALFLRWLRVIRMLELSPA